MAFAALRKLLGGEHFTWSVVLAMMVLIIGLEMLYFSPRPELGELLSFHPPRAKTFGLYHIAFKEANPVEYY